MISRSTRRGAVTAGIIGGITAGVVISLAILVWNAYSGNGLGSAFGGITLQELAEQLAKNPGPPGPQGDTGPPGRPGPAPSVSLISGDFEKSGPIPASETYSLCTLSKIVLPRNARSVERSCQLGRGAQPQDGWEITVNEAICGVTCIKFEK